MAAKVTNNAFGTLSVGITTTSTTISLGAGQGARFPALGAGDYFYATLVDTANNIEIIKATARSVDSMTVVRAQDGTTAKAYALNDRLELRPIAALFNEKVDLETITSVSRGGTGQATLPAGSVVVGNGTSAVSAVAPGTFGNILSSSGSTWVSSTPPQSGFSNMQVLTSTNATYPIPATRVKVTVVGGGGNGSIGINSGFNTPATAGGSGGGGGAAIGVISGLTVGDTIAATVGGATLASSFGTYISATPGTNGTSAGVQGTGGVGQNGTINFYGFPGDGLGGASGLSMGLGQNGGTRVTRNGLPFGGGGTGSAGTSTIGTNGPGVGAAGVIIIEY